MTIADLPLFQALKTKMKWHQSRQGVLAENVANADTPGYQARDLKKVDFDDTLKKVSRALVTSRTHPAHIEVRSGPAYGFDAEKTGQFEVTPDGNGVALEEQMMKLTSNQMDYQTATTLYSRSLGLIRTAIKRG